MQTDKYQIAFGPGDLSRSQKLTSNVKAERRNFSQSGRFPISAFLSTSNLWQISNYLESDRFLIDHLLTTF